MYKKRYDDGGSVGDSIGGAIGSLVDKLKAGSGKDTPKMPAMPAASKEADVISSPTNIPMIGQKKGGTVKRTTWRKYGW